MYNFTFPKTWSLVPIRDIAKITYGKSLSRKERSKVGAIPVFGSGGIIGYTSKPLFEKPSIVIGRKGTVGSIFYTQKPFWCIDTAFYIQDISEIIHIEYLAFILEMINLKRLTIVVGIPGISRKDIEAQQIPIPTLPEQQEIVKILQQGEIVKKYRADISEKQKQLKLSLFYELFGEPSGNEKGWKTSLLGEVLSETPKDGPHESPKYTPTGIPFLSTRNIKPAKVIWEDLKYISKTNAEKYWKKCKPQRGDILYTKGGTTGYAKVIDFSKEIAIWVHLALLRPNNKKVNSVWLEQMLNTPYCYFQSQKLTRGAVNSDLGLKRMIKIKILLPPLKLQEKYADIVAQIDSLVANQHTSTEKIKQLNQSLKIQAFTGQLTQNFRRDNQFAITEYAKLREQLLQQKESTGTDSETTDHKQLSSTVLEYLSQEQKEILEVLNASEGYQLIQYDFKDLDMPTNQIQRNLDLLAAIGLIKALYIPVPYGQANHIFYTKAYRKLQDADDSQSEDIDSFAKTVEI